jgi:hypothetical protein
MKHIERTIEWNNIRGNTPDTLRWRLELDMLKEELQELQDAIIIDSPVDIFDALLDLQFVLIGSLGKMGLTAQQIRDGYEAVLAANETKSSTKNAEGKITKPANFKGPEKTLEQILKN